MEEFRDLKGFDNYQISNLGRIYSKKRKVCLKIRRLGNSGYYQVRLFKDGRYIYKNLHRLIAETFIPNPNNYKTVNHINGNKLDNRISNLEWMDESDQQYHALMTGLKRHTKHTLTKGEIWKCYELYFVDKFTVKELAEYFNTRTQQISKLISGQRHKKLFRQYQSQIQDAKVLNGVEHRK